MSSDTCVPYEKTATGQDEKQQLTLRTWIAWRHQASKGSCYSEGTGLGVVNKYTIRYTDDVL